MSTDLRAIAASLGGGKEKRQGEGWLTLCPVHDDNTPSLSLNLGAKGQLLFNCLSGCDGKEVGRRLQEQGLLPSYPTAAPTWKVLPYAPPGTPRPDLRKARSGTFVKSWEYKDEQGRVCGYVSRFDQPGGKKEIIQTAWAQNVETGVKAWAPKSMNKPRPLYGLDLLVKEPKKPVLVVEGEKACDAARNLFSDMVVVTWPGGSSAVKHVKWESLQGRDVTLWPDADEPGLKAMKDAGEILAKLPSTQVKTVTLPDNLPKGWDLADEVPEGVELDRRALVITAKEFNRDGDRVVQELNKELSIAILGNKTIVIWEKEDPQSGRILPNYMGVGDVKTFFANQTTLDGKQEVNVIDYWLKSPERKSYRSVVFEPERELRDAYNLWRGFTVEASEEGEWTLLDEHIQRNIAQGDESLYRWVLGWFAQMMQHPATKLGTSLALRGKQGTGKTILGTHMGALIRDHYVLVDDPRYVIGQFNSHMAQALLLQADEGFFAGDPRHVGRLKGLVTSPTNRIEPKGKESFEINNYMRLMITSNSEWIVPTAFEERRFAVLDVGEDSMQDRSYFEAMRKQLLNGGYERLLYDLLRFDLDSVNLGLIPKTKALVDQKEESLTPFQKFWFERLLDGEIWPGSGSWPKRAPSERLWQFYCERLQAWGVTRKLALNSFGKELRKFMPVGYILERVRVPQGQGERPWGWELPDLEACREAYDLFSESKTSWDKADLNPSRDLQDDIPF